MTPQITSGISRKKPALLAASVLALLLGGCAQKYAAVEKTAEIPDNYQERHPIVVGDAIKSLDVFLVPNTGIDHRQAEDVRVFVRDYKKEGKGTLVAILPPQAPRAAVQFTLREIRRVAGGIRMQVTSGPTYPTAASVRLSYATLEAKLASKCGQWPHDLTGGTSLQSWTNRPYYNLGCSNQSMMAAQAANPIDHVRPRQEGPYDLIRRLNGIESVREGKNPATDWPTETDKISKALN